MLIEIERTEGGITKGAADAARTELDATKNSRNDEQSLEIMLSEKLQELHPGPADLAVVPRLLHHSPVLVPHPARPAVVAGLVVGLFALRKLLLHVIEGRHRHRSGMEARTSFGEIEFSEFLDAWHVEIIPGHPVISNQYPVISDQSGTCQTDD